MVEMESKDWIEFLNSLIKKKRRIRKIMVKGIKKRK
jgi:hypothetical protein